MGFCKESAGEIKKAGVSTIKLHTGKPIPGTIQKERRVRFLLPLHWLYDFCVDEDIEDLERLELSQINQFEKIVEQKVVNVKKFHADHRQQPENFIFGCIGNPLAC